MTTAPVTPLASVAGTACADAYQRADHGAHCDCLMLCAAARTSSAAVSYSYCRNVLQRRYIMTCEHGPRVPIAEPIGAVEPWHGFDKLDAVQAMLLCNR